MNKLVSLEGLSREHATEIVKAEMNAARVRHIYECHERNCCDHIGSLYGLIGQYEIWRTKMNYYLFTRDGHGLPLRHARSFAERWGIETSIVRFGRKNLRPLRLLFGPETVDEFYIHSLRSLEDFVQLVKSVLRIK